MNLYLQYIANFYLVHFSLPPFTPDMYIPDDCTFYD